MFTYIEDTLIIYDTHAVSYALLYACIVYNGVEL